MQRYKIRCNDCDPKITPHENGKWVRWGDVERLRAELAKANGYINRLRDMLTDANPCIDPSRDACNCILCELVSRDRQQAALAAKEEK